MHSNFCCVHIYVYRNNKKYSCCYWWRPSASIIIGRCSLHVLLTSRPGSPSLPCQRTTVAILVFPGFMNRLPFSLRLPGHATLLLELLHRCEKDPLLISITHFFFTKSSEMTVNVAVTSHENVFLYIRLNSLLFCRSWMLGIQVINSGVKLKAKTI